MIVLDEQLLGRGIESEIAQWYHDTVRFINELRPDTVIKDDSIPELLRGQAKPTFISINERDFWRRVRIDNNFSVVCFVLPDSRVKEIPALLRSLLQRSEFNAKIKRMGKVVRVTDREISYYAHNHHEVKNISVDNL